MFELEIKGTVYTFKFGMGFMREINKRMNTPVDGVPNAKKNIGMQYYVAGIMDKEVETLVDMLDAANIGQAPRVTKGLLDDYIDEPSTDINKLFDDVMVFLEQSNATKNVVVNLKEMVEAEKQKRANQ